MTDQLYKSGILFYYESNMWKEFYYVIQEKPFMKEFVNYCLSYTLCQPVDIDLQLVLMLAIQYLGLYQLVSTAIKIKLHWNGRAIENYSIEIKA